jgi:hypothetical protein
MVQTWGDELHLGGAMSTATPTLVPMLTRGKHRSPRKGACFMEFASYLAGERWSDHPHCTHPLLAAVARLVNDNTSDQARQRLTGLIPSVIGLTSADPRWNALIARRAAVNALPRVSYEHQRALAVGLLTCERVLAELDGRPLTSQSALARETLAAVPSAERWARQYCGDRIVPTVRFHRRSAPSIVLLAVGGIAEGCGPDRDDVLLELLTDTIADCVALREDVVEPAAAPVESAVSAVK